MISEEMKNYAELNMDLGVALTKLELIERILKTYEYNSDIVPAIKVVLGVEEEKEEEEG